MVTQLINNSSTLINRVILQKVVFKFNPDYDIRACLWHDERSLFSKCPCLFRPAFVARDARLTSAAARSLTSKISLSRGAKLQILPESAFSQQFRLRRDSQLSLVRPRAQAKLLRCAQILSDIQRASTQARRWTWDGSDQPGVSAVDRVQSG